MGFIYICRENYRLSRKTLREQVGNFKSPCCIWQDTYWWDRDAIQSKNF